MTDLLSCPFCGGEPIADDLGDPMDDSFIHCSKCAVQQIANYTPERAAERWNQRTPSPSGTSAGEISERARELLAAEFEAVDRPNTARDIRDGYADEIVDYCFARSALRAIESALRSQGRGEAIEQVISAWAFAHNIDGAARNDLFRRLAALSPPIADVEECEVLVKSATESDIAPHAPTSEEPDNAPA